MAFLFAALLAFYVGTIKYLRTDDLLQKVFKFSCVLAAADITKNDENENQKNREKLIGRKSFFSFFYFVTECQER